MEKATFVTADYIESCSLTIQGNHDSISLYLNDGFHVQKSERGFWILVKPCLVKVTLKTSTNEQRTFDMKQSLLEHYGRKKMSFNLYERFYNEASSGKIKFYINDFNYSLY